MKQKRRGEPGEGRGQYWEALPLDWQARGARVDRPFLDPEDTEKGSGEGRRVSKESRPVLRGCVATKMSHRVASTFKEWEHAQVDYIPFQLPAEVSTRLVLGYPSGSDSVGLSYGQRSSFPAAF